MEDEDTTLVFLVTSGTVITWTPLGSSSKGWGNSLQLVTENKRRPAAGISYLWRWRPLIPLSTLDSQPSQ